MSKAKMQAASELIKEKRYDEAHVILQTIDHPEARFLLMFLPALGKNFPETSTRFTAVEAPSPPNRPENEMELYAVHMLIDEKRYEDALALLRAIDDPEAHRMLRYLEEHSETYTRFTALESDADASVDVGPDD
jgi:hypothetical protein